MMTEDAIGVEPGDIDAARRGRSRSRRRRKSGSLNRAARHFEALETRVLLSVSSTLFDVTTSSYLGGSATDDGVRGTVIQSDGTIVIAANISDAAPGGLTPTLLNGATGASAGAIIRLSANGSSVLSVTRLASKVLDLAADATGNLYVAMYTDGFAKLNASASAIVWQKSAATLGIANVQRIDAGPTGYVAVLGGGSLDSSTTLGDSVLIFNPSGTQLGSSVNTKWKNDVTIDETSQTVIYLGYRNANDSASGLPVQIAYFRGVDYTGATKYNGYDFSGSAADPNYINFPTNNMADTRGYRADIGDDGKLYMSFTSAGGNFIFRYNPFNVSQTVTIAGGDAWNSAYNLTTPLITFFGKYDPATGNYLAGNELLARLPDTSGNTLNTISGNITADASGRVYIAGSSAWGLPLPTHPSYTFDATRPAFNPGVNSNYLGGAFLVVMDSTLTNRLYTTRLTSDNTRAVAVRQLPSGGVQLAFGGDTGGELYLRQAGQTAMASSKDGWYAVIADSSAVSGNSAPVAAFSITPVSSGGGFVTLSLNASATTDANGNPLTYLWTFGDGTSATGQIVQHTFDASSNRTIVLTVTDTNRGWSQESKTIGPPVAAFTATPYGGVTPAIIAFDASATTDPDHTNAQLTFAWDFGDGTTGTGSSVSHTYGRGGIFTATLTVTDPYGAANVITRTLAIARDGGYARRLDFQSAATGAASGYTAVPVALYSAAAGFGYAYIDGDFGSGTTGTDPVYGDYHSFAKYPTTPRDGEFMVDVPNGTYTVIARFSHSDAHSFPGLTAEGRRVVGNITVNSNRIDRVFSVTITDGQLNIGLIGPYWAISALEIVDTGTWKRPNTDASVTVDPGSGPTPLTVRFDASGYNQTAGLTYNWDFGDGTTGTGVTVSHTYAVKGNYPVTLTLTGTSARVVDFGGDYVSSSSAIVGVRAVGNLDLDGDSVADDSVSYIPFGTQPTGFMVDVSAGGTKPSGRVYGGMATQRIDSATASASITDASIANAANGDYINMRDQPNTPGVRHHAALLWIKQDFLGGAHAQRTYFAAGSAMRANFLRFENLSAGRWLVQDGDTLYVSQSTFTGTGLRTLDPLATNWAVYAPGADWRFDFDQAAAVFSPHTFTDIRSLGLYLERDTGATARVWYQIDSFEVDAATAAATGTVFVTDPPPQVTIALTDAVASEAGSNPGVFTITRTGATTDPLTVTYLVSGSASAADYDALPLLSGQVTIPSGASSVTITVTPYDDLLFESDETLTLALTSQPTYFVSNPSSATLTIIDNEGPFVNWQGNYVSGNQNLRPAESSGTGTLTLADYNGDSVTDARRTYSFSTTNTMSPTVAAGTYAGSSARFFGGASYYRYSQTSASFDTHLLQDNTTSDNVSLRAQPGGGTIDFDTAWVWLAADFLDNSNPKTMGANSVLTASFSRLENVTGRWLLGDGTNYYVSQQTFTGSSMWTGATLGSSMWARYTPGTTNLDFNQAAANFNVSIASIPVRAVGFITDVDGGTSTRYWVEFSQFTVEEGNNPAPLVIQGTSGDDAIRLVRSRDNLQVFINNAGTVPNITRVLDYTTTVSIAGLGGNDTVTIDLAGGDPVPAGGLTVDGGAGTNALAFLGSVDADAFTATAAGVSANGSALVTRTNTSALSFAGGGGDDTLLLDGSLGSPIADYGLSFDGGAGDNTVTFNLGNYYLTGGFFSTPDSLSVVINAGTTLTIGDPPAGASVAPVALDGALAMYAVLPENAAPAITSAGPSNTPISAASATLSATATDDGGDENLVYRWSVVAKPAGAADPIFTENASHAAQLTEVKFSQAGAYVLRVTVADASGAETSTDVPVEVARVLARLALDPAVAILETGTTRQFTVAGFDQFGAPMGVDGPIAWSAAGVGSVSLGGLYTAGSTPGTATLRAQAAGSEATAAITVIQARPRLAATLGGVSLVSGQTIDLGTTRTNKPLSLTITLTNVGTIPLRLGAIQLPDGYALAEPPAGSLAPGVSTTLTIRLKARAPGVYAGKLVIGVEGAQALQLFLIGTVTAR